MKSKVASNFAKKPAMRRWDKCSFFSHTKLSVYTETPTLQKQNKKVIKIFLTDFSNIVEADMLHIYSNFRGCYASV